MDTSTLLIGIAGQKGHGKDTVAQAMRDHILEGGIMPSAEVHIMHFADPLKSEVAQFLAALPAPPDSLFGRHHVPDDDWMTTEENFFYAMNGTPEEKAPFRLLLQWWGTEYRRGNFGDTYWTDQLRKGIESKIAQRPHYCDRTIIIVPDMRFPNEANFIYELGGYALRVVREGAGGSEDAHPSERALDDYELPVYVNKTREDWEYHLREDALSILQAMVDWKWSGR